MNTVTLTIDGISVTVPSDYTILEAAKEASINIPTLCYLKDLNKIGACRLCLVEVAGARGLLASCITQVADGMVVKTNTAALRKARKLNLELLLSNHNRECTTCVRSQNCELQALCRELGVDEYAFDGSKNEHTVDELSPSIVRDNSKCINCRRCIAACNNMQKIGAIGATRRGFSTSIGCVFDRSLADSPCINCGQCIIACPVGALHEKSSINAVWSALNDPEKVVIVQPAPAVRASLGEEFGMPMGTAVTGKLAAALRRLGFDKVFDTDFGADLTILEEGTELLNRLNGGGALPMITSCSPGWVKYCETFFPEFIPNLSTCKSPQQMTGALIKTWFAEREGIDPNNIVSVSVMPCVAKKFEINRDDEDAAGVPDVDISITTRELARMIKMAQLNFARLPEEDFDPVMGVSTGAATIFGATGGVLEAALRTAADVLEGVDHDNIEYKEIRGTKGFKEAVYKVAGMDVKVAVVSGLNNANELLKKIESGEADYHIVEVMCCPGGCVNGGGQPIQPSTVRSFTDIKALRAKALYDEDAAKTLRKSHLNPVVKECYEWMGGEPGCHKAHELLHTSYVKRDRF